VGYRYFIADVFTDRPFTGNQLAVFPDAQGLSPSVMQSIAREFNFPESTFVFPPENGAHAARVRIFTPKTELPFAGHPTLGTAAVLAHLKRVKVPRHHRARGRRRSGAGGDDCTRRTPGGRAPRRRALRAA
jgi:trans-2,3-dihydro-3-hydroxyanthranilate isomerase